MKTSGAAVTSFLLALTLSSPHDVWAKLRSTNNATRTEEHRVLNHKSNNYYQSKLRNPSSGKCIGFDVANDVDSGDAAKWVNCRRAPTFEYQNPQFTDKYYLQKKFNDTKTYQGNVFALTFLTGSLSESSSTSDFRQYFCLVGGKKGVTAKPCKSGADDQRWFAIAVRGRKDTWRFKNAKTRGMIEYKLEEAEIDNWDLDEIKLGLVDAFGINKNAKTFANPVYLQTVNRAQNRKNNKNNHHKRRALVEETMGRVLSDIRQKASMFAEQINQFEAEPVGDPVIVTTEPAGEETVEIVTAEEEVVNTEDAVEIIPAEGEVATTEDMVVRLPAEKKLKPARVDPSVAEQKLIDLLQETEVIPVNEKKLVNMMNERKGIDQLVETEAFVAVVSGNGTIFDYEDQNQWFVDLDCRFIFGENPLIDDGWYNGRESESTRPPEKDN